MTLGALLAIVGVILAIYALAKPPQRKSIGLFVPLWIVIAGLSVSGVLLLALEILVQWDVRAPGWKFALGTVAFLVPLAVTAWAVLSWHRAKLEKKSEPRFRDFLLSCIRDGEFDESVRILTRNRDHLAKILTEDTVRLIFDSQFIRAMVSTRSWLHLELLADRSLLKRLPNHHRAVDCTVRELLTAEVSPLRSAVLDYDSTHEPHPLSQRDRSLMERTFLDPEWYLTAGPDRPLTHAAVEQLQSGRLDAEYNDSGRNYETRYGLSTRSSCPVFLAVKAQVMAIERAIEAGTDGDFYVTNLCQLFRFIAQRSEYRADVWESPLNNAEHPTPYSYLLYEIHHDMWNLSAAAIKKGTPEEPVRCPTIAGQLATSWASCVGSAVDYCTAERPRISREFMLSVVTSFFDFLLLLEFEHFGFFMGQEVPKAQVEPWVKLFVDAFKRRGIGFRQPEKAALREAYNSLDTAQYRVQQGKEWLGKELGLA